MPSKASVTTIFDLDDMAISEIIATAPKVFVYVIGASSSGPVTSKERSVFEKFGQYIRARYLVDSDDFTLARVTRPMCPRLVSSTNVRLLPALLIYDHGALVSVTEGVSMSNGSVKLADMAMSSHNKAEAARLGIAQQPASTDAAAQVETEERAGRLLGVLLSSNVRHLAVKYDPKLKRLNLVKVVLAVLGLALSIIQAEVSFNFPALRDGALVNALRVITSALTAALLLMIVRGYILLLKIDQYRWNLSRRRSLFSSSLLFKCLAELVLCAVHPFPTFGAQLGDRPYFPDGTTFGSFVVNEMVPTLMFTRIFLLFPLIRDYSPVWTSRKEIISGAVGSGGGAVSDGSQAFSAEFGWFLALKTLFFFKPVIFILVCISVAPICFSYVILVAERRYQPALLSKFSSSLWYTAITMLTVGYGDITAVSIWGRSYAVIAGFAGIVITALVITVVSDSLNMSNGERFAATTAKLKAVTEQEMNVAAYFIQFCFKEMMSYRKLRLSNAGRDEVRRHEMTILTKKVALVKSLKSIRKERKELLESTLYAEPLITRLELLQTNITSLSNSVMALVARSVRQQQLLSVLVGPASPDGQPRAGGSVSSLLSLSGSIKRRSLPNQNQRASTSALGGGLGSAVDAPGSLLNLDVIDGSPVALTEAAERVRSLASSHQSWDVELVLSLRGWLLRATRPVSDQSAAIPILARAAQLGIEAGLEGKPKIVSIALQSASKDGLNLAEFERFSKALQQQ